MSFENPPQNIPKEENKEKSKKDGLLDKTKSLYNSIKVAGLMTVGTMLHNTGAEAQTKSHDKEINKTEQTISISKENSEKVFYYSALTGYTMLLNQEEKTDIDRKAGLVELAKYFESLRDGDIPQKLSTTAQIVFDFVIKEIKAKSGKELHEYSEYGKNLKHIGL